VLGVAFLLWLVLFAPRLLVPTASQSDLRDVPDAVRWQARDSRLKLQNDVRTTLLQGLGGLAVLVGASFTYRQLRIAREGQVTERFTRAIDQLGNTNLDVRLGGIYALERIANDSPQDRATVAEVLTAFVRGHAPWPTPSAQRFSGLSRRLPRLVRRPVPETQRPVEVSSLEARAADVQAAMTVLGRRHPSADLHHLNLIRVDLRNAQLAGADLRGAELLAANLLGAELTGANLQDADLRFVNLTGANLPRANLRGADLSGARLRSAELESADLRGADLIRADLQDAWLANADLQGAHLGKAQLQSKTLIWANLFGAHADAATVWPKGFEWKAAGVELHEG
jgi:uncharacterized protein YjbI with pentapeptide repeats